MIATEKRPDRHGARMPLASDDYHSQHLADDWSVTSSRAGFFPAPA
jgi:hypothetical protein